MARIMKGLTATFGILFLLTLGGVLLFGGRVFLSLAITCGVCFYHFLMRLAVGLTVDGIFHNRMNYRARWFSPLPFEKRLYTLLRVKKWKKHIPTYAPDTFSMKEHSLEELAMATCQAETVHEIIMLLSLLPLLLIIPFGDPAVFLITSIGAALFDGMFVILQRYNRPAILYLAEKRRKRAEKTP